MSSLLEPAAPPVSGRGPVGSRAKASQPVAHRPSLTALLEERFLVPANSSPSAPAWIMAHTALSFPSQLRSAGRHYTTRLEGEELRIIGVGRPRRLEQVFRRLFGEVEQGEPIAPRVMWQPDWLDDLDADLVVARMHQWVAPRFQRAGWLIVPDAVRWHGELATLPPAVPSHSLSENLRKVRRYDYSLEQTTEWRDWEEFFETMLVPQAVARFGSDAWLPSRRFIRELAGRGILHFLRNDGRRVGGTCTVRRGETVWLPVTGVLAGDPALLQRGVSIALFSLIFDWARAQGWCRRIDAGRTIPFLNDGLWRSKRNWGLQPFRDPMSHLLAMRIGPSRVLRRAFASQPVITEIGGKLEPYSGGPV